MKSLRLVFAVAVIAFMAAIHPAKADPVGDFFRSIFSGQPEQSQDNKQHLRHKREAVSDAHAHVGGSVVASFYGGGPRKYEPNSHTANGERFNQWGLTAAHRTLPFGTRLNVCYSRCAVVRVNDRGPAKWTGRSLDLSRGAARAIGMAGVGVARVRMAVLE